MDYRERLHLGGGGVENRGGDPGESPPGVVIATTTPNFAYLTGVKLETYERFKAALKCGSHVAAVVPALEAGRVQGEYYRDGEDPAEALRRAASPCPKDVVYIDGGTSLKHFEIIKRAFPGAEYRLADHLFREWRSVKRPEEADKIRKAAEAIRRAIEALELRAGITERQAAAAIRNMLYEAGLEPGPILVQFGPNTALPHQEPTAKRLQNGEAVVIDVTAAYEGYYGDLTHSTFIGNPPPKYLEIYQAVKEAQEAALAQSTPGVPASQLDKAARDLLRRRGLDQYFIHRTGHGLGLEIHEAPEISPNSPDVLKPGMVFTIEPGVYIPGQFGVRLEIDVYIAQNGAEVL